MSKKKDEFDEVHDGLPPKTTNQEVKRNHLILFLVVGLILVILIYIFWGSLYSFGSKSNLVSYVGVEALCGAILSLTIGTIQGVLFKARIKSRLGMFIFIAVIGGLVGGLLGGGLRDKGLESAIAVGIIIGGVGGGLSSAFQNEFLLQKGLKGNWFTFSVLSWAAVFGSGWAVSWWLGGVYGLALGAFIIIIGSGIALVSFLGKNPQIEFS